MKINIVLPFFSENPKANVNVMYHYANELAKRGHNVFIYHAIYIPLEAKSLDKIVKKKNQFFQHILRLKNNCHPSWFKLHDSIGCNEITDISNDLIRDADFIFSTYIAVTTKVSELNTTKGIKFNLIQFAEEFILDRFDALYESYRSTIRHIVVSDYLKNKLPPYLIKAPAVIPIAIDPEEFFIKRSIEERNPYCVVIQLDEKANVSYSMDAIQIVLSKYTQLEVHLIVIDDSDRIEGSEYIYHYKPSNLLDLYNQSAIFISPRFDDKSRLSIMEALACGCACIVSDDQGYFDFLVDNITCLLLTEPSSNILAEKIISLIEADKLRIQLARSGHELIEQTSWKKSAMQLEDQFNSSMTYLQRLQTIENKEFRNL